MLMPARAFHILCLLVFLVLTTAIYKNPVYAQDKPRSLCLSHLKKENAFPVENKAYVPLSDEQNKQLVFFRERLRVSLSDVIYNGWDNHARTDYADLKKFFSDTAWSEYKLYVTKQKKRLESLVRYPPPRDRLMNTAGRFEDEKQFFSQSDSEKEFLSEGCFHHGESNLRTPSGHFTLKVIFKDNKETNGPLITHLEVKE